MRHDPKKLYEDILRAIDETECFCQHKTVEDFRTDRALQLIVERELEIIGEAIARLQRESMPILRIRSQTRARL